MTDTSSQPTAVSNVRHILDNITEHEPRLGAVAHRIDEIALADAQRCDELAQCGSSAGSLHGVVFAIKDIIDVAGIPTRSGSLTQASQPPALADASVVRALRAAGAIATVKSNTVEFAIGGWGTNETVGTPWNPWDLQTHRVPGGSSSGTGVLVGSGLVSAGLGTDTGGSVRIPAALCGCVGLKTSIGLVSRSGVTPLSETLDTIGPLAANVELAARMFDVMQGVDSADPTTRDHPGSVSLTDLHRGNAGLRLGVLPFSAMPALTDDVRVSFERAMTLLQDSGVTLAPCELPMALDEYQQLSGKISASEAYATWQELVDDEHSPLGRPNRNRMLLGPTITAPQLVKIRRDREQHIRDFESVIDRFDAIILPTTPMTATPLAEVDESIMPASSYTRMANYLALAALAVPIDLSPQGLPTSLQIVVRRFDDPLALRIGAGFEAARGLFPAALQG